MECVFVVRRRDLFGGDWPQGFVPMAAGAAGDLFAQLGRTGFFVERAEAERSTEWKQLIPYCLVTQGDAIYTVRRLAAGTEGRLHGHWSVGLGGHVGPEDRRPEDPPETFLGRALERELHEELVVAALGSPMFLGLLNDDGNDVGRVHVGLVHRVEALAPVAVREIRKLEGGFRNLVELAPLWQDPTRFESWSRIVLAEFLFRRGSVLQARNASQRDDRREDSRDG